MAKKKSKKHLVLRTKVKRDEDEDKETDMADETEDQEEEVTPEEPVEESEETTAPPPPAEPVSHAPCNTVAEAEAKYENLEKHLQSIKDHPGCTVREFREDVGLDVEAHDVLNGYVFEEAVEEKWEGSASAYYLTQKGKQWLSELSGEPIEEEEEAPPAE